MIASSMRLGFALWTAAPACDGFLGWTAPRSQKTHSILRSTHQLEHDAAPSSGTAEEEYDSESAARGRTALSMTLEELSDALGGAGRARLAWDCYASGVDPRFLFGPNEMDPPPTQRPIWDEYNDREALRKKVIPTLRQTQPLGSSALGMLSSLHSHCRGGIEDGLATLVHVSASSDGTTKLLLRLMDGLEVETVLIPFAADGKCGANPESKSSEERKENSTGVGRTTICVSSQVGCRQGCTFCATGRMGRLRSLTTDEILSQMFFAQKVVRLSSNGIICVDGMDGSVTLPPITNVVFMGMGEPADNAAAVRGAIRILTRHELFRLSASRVTVSTVAPAPDAFAAFGDSECVLAWSVHAARDELRRRLVPTTKFTMKELRRGLIDALKKRRLRTAMVEVALIDGVNDSIREADELAEFVSYIAKEVPGSKVFCNLIPYNDIGGGGSSSDFRKPSMERVLDFQKRLQSLGVFAHVRGTRGDEESAACGQLATSRRQKELMP